MPALPGVPVADEYLGERDAVGCRGAGRLFGVRRPPPVGRGSALAASVLTAALLLAGCAAEGGAEASSGSGSHSSTSVVPSEPATSEPADPTGDGTGGQGSGSPEPADQGSSDGGSGDGDPADGNPGDGDPGDGNPGDGTEGLPGWPLESTPVHGARLWAAYLAVGAPGDPALQQVLDEVQQLWPGAGLGELGCDQGAAESLGRDRAEHAVAVYFATEQHITEFRRRWDGPYVGAVQVTVFCAD